MSDGVRYHQAAIATREASERIFPRSGASTLCISLSKVIALGLKGLTCGAFGSHEHPKEVLEISQESRL